MSAIRTLVPMLHVHSVPRSLEYYARLGFVEGDNTYAAPGSDEPTWAWLETGAAKLMLVRASAPIVAAPQGVTLYLYVDDVVTVHAALASAGLEVGEIDRPLWAPRGEFHLRDPDGHALTIRHGDG